MEKRNVEITLDTARKWYYGDNESLKEVALQAFTKDELEEKHWRNITTIKDAVDYLKKKEMCRNLIIEYAYAKLYSYQSYITKVLEYQIVVAALTNSEELYLTKGKIWYPITYFCYYENKEKFKDLIQIGTIEEEGRKYFVFGSTASNGGLAGLGYFYSIDGVSHSYSIIGLRAVSSKEIAEHISKYFGKLVFEIQYGGTNCKWKWIE